MINMMLCNICRQPFDLEKVNPQPYSLNLYSLNGLVTKYFCCESCYMTFLKELKEGQIILAIEDKLGQSDKKGKK